MWLKPGSNILIIFSILSIRYSDQESFTSEVEDTVLVKDSLFSSVGSPGLQGERNKGSESCVTGRVTVSCVVGEDGAVVVMDEYLVVLVVVLEDTEEDITGLVGVTV